MAKTGRATLTLEAIDAFMESDWAVWNSDLLALEKNQQAVILVSRIATDIGALSLSVLQKYEYTSVEHELSDKDIDIFMANLWMNVQYLASIMGRSLSDVFLVQMKSIQKKIENRNKGKEEASSEEGAYSKPGK